MDLNTSILFMLNVFPPAPPISITVRTTHPNIFIAVGSVHASVAYIRNNQSSVPTVASSSSNILFDDLFKVSAVDRDGKKFDRVSRINAKSENHEMDLTLDVNTDLWPLTPNDTFSFVLANSLTSSDSAADGINGVHEGGSGETATPSWRLDTGKSMGLADEYEYVMYGKVYKFDGAAAERVTAYASFGGLLMALTGAYRHVSNITVGDNIYLLARK